MLSGWIVKCTLAVVLTDSAGVKAGSGQGRTGGGKANIQVRTGSAASAGSRPGNAGNARNAGTAGNADKHVYINANTTHTQ